jgi:hypothetical protein
MLPGVAHILLTTTMEVCAMKQKTARMSRPRRASQPTGMANEESVTPSATAVAAEAMRTGVVPLTAGIDHDEIPGADARRLQQGDPDVSQLNEEYVGDEGPGGDQPTPDQNSVDAMGAAMGLQEEDGGPLQSAGDIMARRDRKRAELEPPGRPEQD